MSVSPYATPCWSLVIAVVLKMWKSFLKIYPD